ncbi:hypothetical protein M0802_011454 [Mischocyttarus mexicanus]|nr:hypothetical protein M0802_011454 [Mischocyttarus mexicanus]
MDSEQLHIIAFYAPDASKPLEDYKSFCQQLQDEIDSIPIKEKIIIMGDMNARVGNDDIEGVKERFNENVINEHGEIMTGLCAQNERGINNSFFQH